MIVGERKPFNEIKESVSEYKKLLVLGCGTCVSVCMAGGEKEVELLASQLRMARQLDGTDTETGETTIQRQCDREYIEPIIASVKEYDAVISMGCGSGVQLVAELLEPLPVVPALNTRFIGVSQEEGVWAERCRACGECMLADYAGICPITMCAKSILNGPCGGSSGGKCEVGDWDCAWVKIIERLTKQGKLDKLLEMPLRLKDFSCQQHPTTQVNEAYSEMQTAETPGE
ncbi:methylenetetrahydrofolate reductase C-terminal domain-containing protein [Chloroflexota bacterium]